MDIMTIPVLIIIIVLVMVTNAFQRFSALIKAIKNCRKAMDKTMKNAYGYIQTLNGFDHLDQHELSRIIDCFKEIHRCQPTRLPILYEQLFNRLDYLQQSDPNEHAYQSLYTMVEPLLQYRNQYNGYIHLYNQSLFQFPYSIVARWMHLAPMQTIDTKEDIQ